MANINNGFQAPRVFLVPVDKTNQQARVSVATAQEAKVENDTIKEVDLISGGFDLQNKIEIFAKNAATEQGAIRLDQAHRSNVANMYDKHDAVRQVGTKNEWVKPQMRTESGRLYHTCAMPDIKSNGTTCPMRFWHAAEKGSRQGHISQAIHMNSQGINTLVELHSEKLASLSDDKVFKKDYTEVENGNKTKKTMRFKIDGFEEKHECNGGGVRYSKSTYKLDVQENKNKESSNHEVSLQVLTAEGDKHFNTKAAKDNMVFVAQAVAASIKLQHEQDVNPIPGIMLSGLPLPAAVEHELIKFFLDKDAYTSLNKDELIKKITTGLAESICAIGIDRKSASLDALYQAISIVVDVVREEQTRSDDKDGIERIAGAIAKHTKSDTDLQLKREVDRLVTLTASNTPQTGNSPAASRKQEASADLIEKLKKDELDLKLVAQQLQNSKDGFATLAQRAIVERRNNFEKEASRLLEDYKQQARNSDSSSFSGYSNFSDATMLSGNGEKLQESSSTYMNTVEFQKKNSQQLQLKLQQLLQYIDNHSKNELSAYSLTDLKNAIPQITNSILEIQKSILEIINNPDTSDVDLTSEISQTIDRANKYLSELEGELENRIVVLIESKLVKSEDSHDKLNLDRLEIDQDLVEGRLVTYQLKLTATLATIGEVTEFVKDNPSVTPDENISFGEIVEILAETLEYRDLLNLLMKNLPNTVDFSDLENPMRQILQDLVDNRLVDLPSSFSATEVNRCLQEGFHKLAIDFRKILELFEAQDAAKLQADIDLRTQSLADKGKNQQDKFFEVRESMLSMIFEETDENNQSINSIRSNEMHQSRVASMVSKEDIEDTRL